MIAAELLKLMCCPETYQELRFAEDTLIADLNRRIEQRTLKNRSGEMTSEKIDGGLLRADGKLLYPVRRDIPVLLVEEAIPL
jgi:uncharacterized protein YbaR (Trm112 family)